MKDRLLSLKDALEIVRKKHREISPLTVKKWLRDGLLKGRTEKHGLFDWHFVYESSVRRLYDELPTERIIGLPLLSEESIKKLKKAK